MRMHVSTAVAHSCDRLTNTCSKVPSPRTTYGKGGGVASTAPVDAVRAALALAVLSSEWRSCGWRWIEVPEALHRICPR